MMTNHVSPTEHHSGQPKFTAEQIQDWIINYLCENAGMTPDDVDIGVPFENYAVDSVIAISMTGDMELWLGRRIEPTIFFNYPTIEELSEHLAQTD